MAVWEVLCLRHPVAFTLSGSGFLQLLPNLRTSTRSLQHGWRSQSEEVRTFDLSIISFKFANPPPANESKFANPIPGHGIRRCSATRSAYGPRRSVRWKSASASTNCVASARKSVKYRNCSTSKKPPASPSSTTESTGCTKRPPAPQDTTRRKWRDICWASVVSTASC